MDKKEFRVLIKYCFLKGKNTLEAKTWINAQFPDTIRGKSTIKDCHRFILCDEINTACLLYNAFVVTDVRVVFKTTVNETLSGLD
ncbi:hypothetical protein GWI33_014394 [Rhynchophorus ferrugineus]|uniref:Mos1 transposase HTH domain-containing protein n=1 Tax=Rhynchophorus ferrugineus TaxID=354439 RepID=A0A834I564_RHYFE|nr:hypothetical protein GWI33_014394 [Rhynchophorus ferrugineus]